MAVEQIDPIAAVREKRLAKGTWKAERRRLFKLEKKVGPGSCCTPPPPVRVGFGRQSLGVVWRLFPLSPPDFVVQCGARRHRKVVRG